MYQNIEGTPEGIWLLETSNRALRVFCRAAKVYKADTKEAPTLRWAVAASPTRFCVMCGAAKAAEMLDRYDQGDKCLTNLTPKLMFLESRATENILRVVERVEGSLFRGRELDIVKERVQGRS